MVHVEEELRVGEELHAGEELREQEVIPYPCPSEASLDYEQHLVQEREEVDVHLLMYQCFHSL